MRGAGALLGLMVLAGAARGESLRVEAQRLQRTRGFEAAFAYLEGHLQDRYGPGLYAEEAIWAGKEAHAAKVLEKALPDGSRKAALLSWLYQWEGDFARSGAVLRAAKIDPESARYQERQAAIRVALAGRKHRAAWVALGALVVFSAAALFLARRAAG